MIVKIFTLEKGIEIIENVLAIRIKSNDYNLLILKDYVSTLGEIEGDLELELEREKKTYNNIKASYMHDNNIFSIIFDEDKNDWLFL